MWKDKEGNPVDIEKMIRLDKNGKFINENTQIIHDKENDTITFINKFDDEEQRLVIHLKDKEKK